MRLAILLLNHSDNLSKSLQAKDLCVAEAQKISKKTIKTLKKMKLDKKFELLWKDVQNKASNLRIDSPKLTRIRRAPPRTDEYPGGNAAPEFEEYIVSYYRKVYY